MEHHDPVANLDRMQALASYDLFDPELAVELRSICQHTATDMNVAVAAVQVVLDTATAVLATNGTDADFLTPYGGVPNEHSLCVNVVRSEAPYAVDDLTTHPAHAHNPGVRAGLLGAYAGVPLTLPSGEIIGSHCVIHPEPHHFTDNDLAHLSTAATQIVDHITRRHLAAHP